MWWGIVEGNRNSATIGIQQAWDFSLRVICLFLHMDTACFHLQRTHHVESTSVMLVYCSWTNVLLNLKCIRAARLGVGCCFLTGKTHCRRSWLAGIMQDCVLLPVHVQCEGHVKALPSLGHTNLASLNPSPLASVCSLLQGHWDDTHLSTAWSVQEVSQKQGPGQAYCRDRTKLRLDRFKFLQARFMTEDFWVSLTILYEDTSRYLWQNEI